MSSENKLKDKASIDTTNIFEEFSSDQNLKQEVKNQIESEEKGIFYYLSIIASFIQSLFWFSFIIFIIWWVYIYIQKDLDKTNTSWLNPFCPIVLWNIPYDDVNCSSILSLNSYYKKQLEDEKLKQHKSIDNILIDLYNWENFSQTKKISFLTNTKNNKLSVLKILKDFDYLIWSFEPSEEQKIKCLDIEITSNNMLKAQCEVYSRSYESWVKWYDATNNTATQWTSISIANSFLNFIEKDSTFTIIDRQKMFSSQSVVWDMTWFTQKTVFYITLKYNIESLSL